MLRDGDVTFIAWAWAGCRLPLENYRHVLLTFEYYFSILMFEFELQLPPCYPTCLLSQMKGLPAADAPSRQEQHPMSLQTLADGHTMSFDVEGASARSFLLTSPARPLFPSPLSFRLTDEGAVSSVLDTNGIRRKKEKQQKRETTNIDFQEAVLVFLSMGSAHNHVHFHQDEHQNRHQHHHHYSRNISSPTASSSSSRIRAAVPSSATLNSILTATTSPPIPSTSSPRFDPNVFSTAPTRTILAKRKQIHNSTQSF